MDFGVKYLDRWTAKYSCDYLTTGFVFKRLTMTTRQQLHVTSEHNFAAVTATVVAVVAADAVELMW